MQKLVKVQRKNGTIEEMPDWMANDTRLQRKHGWRVINIPSTVEELKAEVIEHSFNDVVSDGANDGVNEVVVEKKKIGRPKK